MAQGGAPSTSLPGEGQNLYLVDCSSLFQAIYRDLWESKKAHRWISIEEAGVSQWGEVSAIIIKGKELQGRRETQESGSACWSEPSLKEMFLGEFLIKGGKSPLFMLVMIHKLCLKLLR